MATDWCGGDGCRLVYRWWLQIGVEKVMATDWCRGDGCRLVWRRWWLQTDVEVMATDWCGGDGCRLVWRRWWLQTGVEKVMATDWCRGDGYRLVWRWWLQTGVEKVMAADWCGESDGYRLVWRRWWDKTGAEVMATDWCKESDDCILAEIKEDDKMRSRRRWLPDGTGRGGGGGGGERVVSPWSVWIVWHPKTAEHLTGLDIYTYFFLLIACLFVSICYCGKLFITFSSKTKQDELIVKRSGGNPPHPTPHLVKEMWCMFS